MRKIYLLLIIVVILLTTGCMNKTYSGKITSNSGAVDDYFGVAVDSPILIRNVEMVQYHKNNKDEVEKVFANYQIESFDGYENPQFPTNFTNKVFYNNLLIDGITLSDEVVSAIIYGAKAKFIKLEDLPTDKCEENNLLYRDGYYFTASNDWEVGDIRISYEYLDTGISYSLTGEVKDNIMNYTNEFNINIE